MRLLRVLITISCAVVDICSTRRQAPAAGSNLDGPGKGYNTWDWVRSKAAQYTSKNQKQVHPTGSYFTPVSRAVEATRVPQCSENQDSRALWNKFGFQMAQEEGNRHALLKCIDGPDDVRYKISCSVVECRHVVQVAGMRGWCFIPNRCLSGCQPLPTAPTCNTSQPKKVLERKKSFEDLVLEAQKEIDSSANTTKVPAQVGAKSVVKPTWKEEQLKAEERHEDEDEEEEDEEVSNLNNSTLLSSSNASSSSLSSSTSSNGSSSSLSSSASSSEEEEEEEEEDEESSQVSHHDPNDPLQEESQNFSADWSDEEDEDEDDDDAEWLANLAVGRLPDPVTAGPLKKNNSHGMVPHGTKKVKSEAITVEVRDFKKLILANAVVEVTRPFSKRLGVTDKDGKLKRVEVPVEAKLKVRCGGFLDWNRDFTYSKMCRGQKNCEVGANLNEQSGGFPANGSHIDTAYPSGQTVYECPSV